MTLSPTEFSIDENNVFTLLDEVVQEAGEDYVYFGQYSSCMYWDEKNKTPACIIGKVLAKVGVDLSGMPFEQPTPTTSATSLNTKTFNSPDVKAYLADQGVTISPGAQSILVSVQNHQDGGLKWALAVKQEKEWAGLVEDDV